MLVTPTQAWGGREFEKGKGKEKHINSQNMLVCKTTPHICSLDVLINPKSLINDRLEAKDIELHSMHCR